MLCKPRNSLKSLSTNILRLKNTWKEHLLSRTKLVTEKQKPNATEAWEESFTLVENLARLMNI